jgi:hypothetical protein
MSILSYLNYVIDITEKIDESPSQIGKPKKILKPCPLQFGGAFCFSGLEKKGPGAFKV